MDESNFALLRAETCDAPADLPVLAMPGPLMASTMVSPASAASASSALPKASRDKGNRTTSSFRPLLVDPSVVFGRDTDFLRPHPVFTRLAADPSVESAEFRAFKKHFSRQSVRGLTPCAFTAGMHVLPPQVR